MNKRGENLEHLALSKCCSVDQLENLCQYWHLRASADGNVSILCLNRAQSHISKSAPERVFGKICFQSFLGKFTNLVDLWFGALSQSVDLLDFIARDKLNLYVHFTLCSSSLYFSFISFFPTWADRTPLPSHTLYFCTFSLHPLYTSVRRSFLSYLSFPALSSRLLPSLALPALLLSAPSLPPSSPLLSPPFLFINLLGCYSPCLALLMKAGCRWGRRSSP